MGCKDDDTCDQPLTKGEFEQFLPWGLFGFLVIYVFIGMNNSRISRVQSMTDEMHEYGTIGAPNQGAMRDKHAIRKLLEESPRSRKRAIQSHDAWEWDRLKQHKRKYLRPSEDKNPYRD